MKTQYSESGLGGIVKPLPRDDKETAWIEEFWRYIVSGHLGLPIVVLAWFDRPVVAQIPISSPVTWKAFDLFNAGKSYDESVKPYGFAHTARIASGTLDAIVVRPASLPHWSKQVAAEADNIRVRRNAEAEPFLRALAAIGGRIAPVLVAEGEREDFHAVLSRYKRLDRTKPEGSLEAFVAALRNELPLATQEDAMVFLCGKHAAPLTRRQALAIAEKRLAHLRPIEEHREERVRLFAPACEPERWMQRDTSPWFNAYTGSPAALSFGPRDPYDAWTVKAEQFSRLAYHYARHAESKSACADGVPCALSLDRTEYRGPLFRRSVRIGETLIVGKESQTFDDDVVTALGELIEDDRLGVLQPGRPDRTAALLQGLSEERVALKSRTSRELVRAVRDGKAATGTPGTERIRATVLQTATPHKREKMLTLGKKRRAKDRDALAIELYASRLEAEAPYWDTFDELGRIVPDIIRVRGRWQVTYEFTDVPKALVRTNTARPAHLYKSPGNLEEFVSKIRVHDSSATRASVLTFFKAHPRRASKRSALAEAQRRIEEQTVARLLRMAS